MREIIKKTEKDTKLSSKIYPLRFAEMEKELKNPQPHTTEKESPAACQQQANLLENPSEHLLKLAAVLKKWKIQRNRFWMKIAFWVFSFSALAISAIPVYLVWGNLYKFSEGWTVSGKIVITFVCSIMALFAIMAGRSSYKAWEKRHHE